MSAEITFTEEQTAEPLPPPPPDKVDVKNGKPKKESKGAETKEDEEGKDGKVASSTSPIMKAIRLSEDQSLKEMLDTLGADGAFSIRITRKWPESWTDASGKRVDVGGFLTKVDKPIDEEWLQNNFGGGTYELMIRKRDNKGKFGEAANRTIMIAGEPNLMALPRAATPQPAQAAAATQPESPSIVNKTLDLMERQLEKAEQRTGGRSGDDAIVGFLRDQVRQQGEANERLLARIEALQHQMANPPKSSDETVKEKLLDKLIDQDSARLQAVRMQYESEIRAIKDAAIENEKRLYDRFERERQDMRNAHEREIALLRQSHETAVTSARSSCDMQISSAKASCDIQISSAKESFSSSLSAKTTSFETQKEILQAEVRKLERDNAELRDDLKELRSKKEKTIIEQVKDLEVIKDALGVGEDERSTAEKIVEAVTNPEAIAAVSKIFKPGEGQPPQQQQQQAERSKVPRPQVIRNKETGEKMILGADGKARPIKPPPIPGQPQLPDIPTETISMVVGYLERSYTAGTDPAIVAQSARASVPEPILMAIRDVGGVDAFLTKVAKLPSSSPLSMTQAGRNWVKKVGKALIGE